VVLLIAGFSSQAVAQSKEQQKCINSINKASQKVAATQGKENTTCVKNFGGEKLPPAQSAQDCLAADNKGKLSKATGKTGSIETKKCVADSATANQAAIDEERGLVNDIFGNPLQDALVTKTADSDGARCQSAAIKATEKLASTIGKTYNKCKKDKLKNGTDQAGLEACQGDDPKNKISGAATKLTDTIGKKCVAPLGAYFPGDCSAEAAAGSSELGGCLAREAQCHICTFLNTTDDMESPCDALDDGLLNGTCRQCGNGFTEPPETCDDGAGNSDVTPDACRTSCELASCGDGVTDSGEFCDDSGNSATCDDDCSAAACGDGFTNPAAGEDCDDSGESATCDADCTSAVCGDGNLNVSAGEECDDGNLNPGDGCSDTCLCGPGSGEVGCQDEQCPDRREIVVYSGTGLTPCLSNVDCDVGTCDSGLSLCVTESTLSTGWTGIAHGSDANDQLVQTQRLHCPGPAPVCGECLVIGVLPETRDCRCASDNRTVCDEPFAADDDDCGGDICNCYLGAPLPLSAGNTPACSVNRLAVDISGTVDLDLGSEGVTTELKAVAYLGINLILPCPACGGTCTAPVANVGNPCAVDINCDTNPGSFDGVCGNYDDMPKDGVRNGTCLGGLNDGEPCDIDTYNSSFPAPGLGGAGMALDCFPDPGKNVSGTGLNISLDQTTGTSALPPANVECGFPPTVTYNCPCGQCSNDSGIACTSDADCVSPGVCESDGGGKPLPDQCTTTENCVDIGGGQGECGVGPNDTLCDGIVRANGDGFIGCLSNADCQTGTIGLDAGACTLVTRRACFLDPVTDTGVADPGSPTVVASFCIPKTSNGGINTVAGLPGPAKIRNQVSGTAFCASDSGTAYTPGVGGCP
jgi:cysteine-rich repeat protein